MLYVFNYDNREQKGYRSQLHLSDTMAITVLCAKNNLKLIGLRQLY